MKAYSNFQAGQYQKNRAWIRNVDSQYKREEM